MVMVRTAPLTYGPPTTATHPTTHPFGPPFARVGPVGDVGR
jgi:hypothetical protein